MRRFFAALAAACCVWLGVTPVRDAGAQTVWNDARTRALVERATARRAEQLADTGLVDYRATARGYLTFLAQIGEHFVEPPRIVKADQLALEVYWAAPNFSKQIIHGRRDTLLFPTDISYHRDHLGIVQNNFPDIIRLGDGDEVRDVPHPLSPLGLQEYDFAIRDSLTIRLPDRTLDVYEVAVRPRDDRLPRIMGALYVEKGSGQVARMAFGFTRSAFIDRQLEDLSIVLENALVEGRFWLPLRQEIEIRRAATWLDYPVRGIIRGRWEICCYDVNVGLSRQTFVGPEIVTLPQEMVDRYPWQGEILDSLPPDVRAVTDADVARVQAEARELVRAQALARASGGGLAARRISDFAVVNRVEGLALGAGATLRRPGGVRLTVSGRYGLSDEQAKGSVLVGLRRASGRGVDASAYRSYRLAGIVPERSLLANSVAAQEFGSDYTDPFDARGISLGVDLGAVRQVRARLEGAWERQHPLTVNATPFTGEYEPVIPALAGDAARLALRLERPTSLSLFGTELRWAAELRGTRFEPRDPASGDARTLVGGSLVAEVERPVGAQRLVLRTVGGAVGGAADLPPQEMVLLGGPVTGPGYDFHAFAGRVGVSQRVEWRAPVPFPSVPLGRFGRTPARMTLAPFATAVYLSDPAGFRTGRAGWSPSVGLGALLFYDLIRVDIARGLRDGRWMFGLDVNRELWGIL